MNAMPRRLAHVAVLVVLFVSFQLAMAAPAPETARGFVPGQAYAEGSNESVNLYSLNAIVSIPLSPTYAVSDKLSYGLTAYYNTGFRWAMSADHQHSSYGLSFGSADFNGWLGAGWRLDFGKVVNFITKDASGHCVFLTSNYDDPGGAIHPLDADNYHTIDGTNTIVIQSTPLTQSLSACLAPTRLWNSDQNWARTADPNTGQITRLTDLTGVNQVNLTYYGSADYPSGYPAGAHDYSSPFPENQEQTWPIKQITDTRGRTINTALAFVAAGTTGRFVLQDVAAPVFGDNPASPTGHWTLHYESRSSFTVPSPAWGALDPNTPPGSIPLLTQIELPADAAGNRLTFTLDYNEHGELSEIRTPSGSRTVYEWGDEYVSSNPDADTPSAYPLARVIVRKTVYPSPYDDASTAYAWSYTHNRLPSQCATYSTVFDKWRTLVTDPEGNDTEYRFYTTKSWSYADRPNYYPRNGAPGAVKIYKGHAPRWVAGATLPSQRDPVDPGTGALTRGTYYRYLYEDPNWGEFQHVLGVQTIYFDDRLSSSFLSLDPNTTNPACLANLEMDTPLASPTLEGWAWQAELHDPNNWAYYPAVNGQEYKKTLTGNLVGPSAIEIQGEGFDMCPLRPVFYEFRSIKEGGNLKELSQYGNGACVRRHDVNGSYDYTDRGVLRTRDVRMIPTWTAGMLTAVSYSGGDPVTADQNAPGNSPVTYTETLGYTAGVLSSRKSSNVSWFSEDRTIDGASGLPSVARDPAGVATTSTYDALARIVTIAPSSPEVATTVVYPAEMQSFTDVGGVPNTHTFSRRVEIMRGSFPTDTSAIYAKYEYDGLGRLVRETRGKPNGLLVERTHAYDGLGAPTFEGAWRAAGSTSSAGTTISYRDGDPAYPPAGRREPFGRPYRVTNPFGNVRTYSYFGLNDRATEYNINVAPLLQASPTDPNTATTTTTYRDFRGNVRIVIPPNEPGSSSSAGSPALYDYDYAGRLTQVRLPQSVALASYSSLRVDRFATTLTGLTQQRSFSYDTLGLLHESVEPEKGHAWEWAHDPLGHPTLTEDSMHRQSRMTYDPAGRLVQLEVTAPNDPVFKVSNLYTYANDTASIGSHGTALSRLIRVESRDSGSPTASAERELTYSGLNGRLSLERDRFAGSWGGSVPWISTSYGFDNYGNLSRLTYPSVSGSPRPPTVIGYQYTHGYLTELDSNKATGDPNALTAMATVGYTPTAAPFRLAYSNGTTEIFSSDAAGRPTSEQVQGPTLYWQSGNHTYDGAGNLIGIGGQHYTYDRIGRLTTSTTAAMDEVLTMYPQTYGYDRFGSMTSRTGTTGGDQVFTVDPNTNRLLAINPATTNLQLSYYDDGALRQDGVYDYFYDDRARLTSVKLHTAPDLVETYGYDDRGWRVNKKEWTTDRTSVYLRGQDGRVLSEFSMPSGSSLEPHWKKDYIYTLGRHIAAIENTEPDEPAGVASSASRVGTTPSVSMTWLPVTNADMFGYHVYRSSSGSGGPFQRMTASPVTTPSYVDLNVVQGATYFYELTAVDMAANESRETAPRKITPGDATPPTAATGLTGVAEDGVVTLSWTGAPDSGGDLAGYRVYRGASGGSLSPLGSPLPVGAASFIDNSIAQNTAYVYELRSLDTAGLESSSSPSVSVDTTPPGGGGGNGGSGSCGDHCMPGSGMLLLPRCPGVASPDSFQLGRPGFCLPGEVQPDLADHSGVEGDYRIVFYHVDHLGTPRVISDEMGAVVGEYALFPYGEEVPGPWSIADSTNTHWFTGHERDMGVGADYMLARFYVQTTARFLAPDPLDFMRHRTEPFASYSYVLNSPLMYSDPTGLDHVSRVCKTLGFFGLGTGLISEGTGLFQIAFGEATPLSQAEFFLGAEGVVAGFASLSFCDADLRKREIAREAVKDCVRSRTHDKCVAAKAHCVQLEGDGEPSDDSDCAEVQKILKCEGSQDPECKKRSDPLQPYISDPPTAPSLP